MGNALDVAKDKAISYGYSEVKDLILHLKNEGYSLRKAASEIGVSHQVLHVWCKEMNIKFSRSQARTKALAKIKTLGYSSWLDYFSARADSSPKEMGTELGVSEATIIRVYNDERNKLENN